MKAVSWAAGVELNYTKKRQRFYYVFTFLTYFYFYLNVFTPMVAPGRSRRVGAKQPQQNILRLTNTKISTLSLLDEPKVAHRDKVCQLGCHLVWALVTPFHNILLTFGPVGPSP